MENTKIENLHKKEVYMEGDILSIQKTIFQFL